MIPRVNLNRKRRITFLDMISDCICEKNNFEGLSGTRVLAVSFQFTKLLDVFINMNNVMIIITLSIRTNHPMLLYLTKIIS